MKVNTILSSSGSSLANLELSGERSSYEQLNIQFCKFQQLLATCSYPTKRLLHHDYPATATIPPCSIPPIPPIPFRRFSSLDFRRIISSFFHASSNSVGFGATW